MADGLTPNDRVAARHTTFAAGSQVPSATLNSMQDDGINLSTDLDEVRGNAMLTRRASYNDGDDPLADEYGGWLLQLEAVSDGTSVVVIDADRDYRGRYIKIEAVWSAAASAVFPGDAGDDNLGSFLTDTANNIWVGFTQDGQDGTAAYPGLQTRAGSVLSSDYLRIFARSTDGALCCKKSADADDDVAMFGWIKVGLKQNH